MELSTEYLNQVNKNKHKHSKPQSSHGYAETYIKLAKSRIIFLSEDVSKEVANEFSSMLLYYDNVDSNDIITLYIHSNGGDLAGCTSMYDVMNMVRAPVRTICLGKAYSAAAVLLAAGTKGERYIAPNAEVMIHGIQCAFPLPGSDTINCENYLDFLKVNNDAIVKMLAKHTSQPVKKVREDCKKDMFMTAKEAIKYGIVDHIL